MKPRRAPSKVPKATSPYTRWFPRTAPLFVNQRETDWLPVSRPPVLEGAYLTRGAGGVCVHHWKRNRWALARSDAAPKEWKGVDVRLTDDEELRLKSSLYHGNVRAALPLLRDALAAHAAAAYPGKYGKNLGASTIDEQLQQNIQRLRRRVCCYLAMLADDKHGRRLLTPDDRTMCKPFLKGKIMVWLIAEMHQDIAAFKRGIDL